MSKLFLIKLNKVENYARHLNNYHFLKAPKKCEICGHPDIHRGMFQLQKHKWSDGLFHLIEKHEHNPNSAFTSFIIKLEPKNVQLNVLTKLRTRMYVAPNVQYLKINTNQILILDALLYHGSGKRYVHEDELKYSEHAGLIDFGEHELDKIIVFGNTKKLIGQDDEIFFPTDISDAYDYEYIFHSHPATPTIGGRMKDGILFEYPSMGDFLTFIKYYNEGKIQGSLIITPEGLYNIRKYVMDNNALKINRDDFIKTVGDKIKKVDRDAIRKYEKGFNLNKFYNVVIQDKVFLKEINECLRTYGLQLDFFARENVKGQWIVRSVKVPVYSVEQNVK